MKLTCATAVFNTIKYGKRNLIWQFRLLNVVAILSFWTATDEMPSRLNVSLESDGSVRLCSESVEEFTGANKTIGTIVLRFDTHAEAEQVVADTTRWLDIKLKR